MTTSRVNHLKKNSEADNNATRARVYFFRRLPAVRRVFIFFSRKGCDDQIKKKEKEKLC